MSISQWDYYRQTSEKISAHALKDIHNLKDWQAAQPRLLREYFESMGLKILPDYREAYFTDYGVVKGKGFRLQKNSLADPAGLLGQRRSVPAGPDARRAASSTPNHPYGPSASTSGWNARKISSRVIA